MSSMNSLRLNLKVTQKQILTPGLVQMVSVLVLNKLELKEMINQEIIENPILEEMLDEGPSSLEEMAANEERASTPADQEILQAEGASDPFDDIDFGSFFDDYLDPGYRTPQAETVELPSFENFLSNPTSLIDHLEWQLTLGHHVPAMQSAITSILGNLNENGYLSGTLEEIAASSGDKLEDLEQALRLVQECDPAGVAARDLRECLLLQLRALGAEGSLPWQIVSDHIALLEGKQHKELAKVLKKTPEEIAAAVEVIRKLDPFPCQRYNQSQPRLIEPDVYIVKSGDEYTVVVNEDDLPQVRLNPAYRHLLEPGGSSREVRNYVKERYASALRLLKNIEQRKQTIVRVCQAIIGRQGDFLDYGVDYLKPMMIKDVAEEVGVHPSTVSRAVASKYAHTPQGVFELRYFFSEAVNGPSGSAIPLLILKRKVKKMIEQEDKANPLTDDQIAHILCQQGIAVNRRTVAKYRADLRIPSTHERRIKQ
ncbi:MAG: RNA polymerase factor sigma-54 [Acidobacteria bacterium]|nr:RNA polymerase factor sigma-54 [Acidobacteriota bacterium]